MNKQIVIFLILFPMLFNYSFAQQDLKVVSLENSTDLFSEVSPLSIKMSYSNKDIKKETNDSTYIASSLAFEMSDGTWKDLDVELRARGNNRLKNCYFAPVKIKLKKNKVENTIFAGHKNLKLVLPCLIQKDNDDNVIKEYVVYKMFEVISPNYFKTRLLDIEYEEQKGKNVKEHQIKGFLIEDDKHVAKRLNGKVYDRNVHPMNQEEVASIRNAMFQFMIGNTDYSQVYQHNVKLIFINETMIPIPYDFDMSGFVNCSYAVVSQIGDEELNMSSVTDRKYRGFKRDVKLFYQVRDEFIRNRSGLFKALEDCEALFDDPREYSIAKDYISSFFDVLVNDSKFEREILNEARTN